MQPQADSGSSLGWLSRRRSTGIPRENLGRPSDAVIVGIYDRYTDQPADNAALVCRYGTNISG